MTEPVSAPVPGHGSGPVEQLLDEPFPRKLMVQTTSGCNSSCVFCPHRLYRDRLPQGEMDDELYRRIVAEAGEHPDVACLNLFLMNEPLMDPRIVERIELARRFNPRAEISLWTNGVALSAERGALLLSSPLTSLGVSLHAQRAETYRRLTGRTDFHRVLRNVVRFVEERNARRPDVTLVLRFVSAAQMEPGEQDELLAFWGEADVTLDIDEGHLGRAGNLPAPGAPPEPHRWMAGCQALGGPKQAHVLFDGQVVLCCMDYGRTSSLGDLRRESLAQVWGGPRRRRYLETLYGRRPADPDTFLCSRCELALPGSP
jgi:pyruvate-formate lyase-activating enzyme